MFGLLNMYIFRMIPKHAIIYPQLFPNYLQGHMTLVLGLVLNYE